MISTFINALSSLAGIDIELTVPAFTVDMQGAIMTVPMAELRGTVGLYYDHWRQFRPQWQNSSLPAVVVSGHSIFKLFAKEAGREQWSIS